MNDNIVLRFGNTAVSIKDHEVVTSKEKVRKIRVKKKPPIVDKRVKRYDIADMYREILIKAGYKISIDKERSFALNSITGNNSCSYYFTITHPDRPWERYNYACADNCIDPGLLDKIINSNPVI